MSKQELGLSGRIAKKFQASEITPLLALVGLLLGLFAIMVTPREEEPQINVTFANVFIPFPGATAGEVESLVSGPAEQVLSEIQGIEHVFSMSRPGMSVLTIQYKVGVDRTEALVRLYNKVASNQDWLPRNLGVGQPLIKPKGIDDVPIVGATLWSDSPEIGDAELEKVAHALEAELKRVPGTRNIYTIGGASNIVSIKLSPQKMAGFGISFQDLAFALRSANASTDSNGVVEDNKAIEVQAGTFLITPEEVGGLVVGLSHGSPVYLSDVADIELGPETPTQYVSHLEQGVADNAPAVTIAIAKKAGVNAVKVAERVVKRFDQLKGLYIPEGVHVKITRDYGKTADEKAGKLIHKLIFATSSVILLVWLSMGWREAIIVGTAIIITLLITLFASWAWGFTLNRVSLFALIFSIGILVDDAIVVVENIHRHMQEGAKNLLEAIPVAIDEVGGPTILATFTVIAALLPMAFVTGLMGPYMSPIPINASMGMLISLAVAYVVTPWLTYKVLKNVDFSHHGGEAVAPWVANIFNKAIAPFLREKKGRKARNLLLLGVIVLMLLSVSLVVFQSVVMKMLPFDNKSEFQVVLDMPEGSSLEQTKRVLDEAAAYLENVEEVQDLQIYAGTAAPINFNGLVRQYYLRKGDNVGDIQVNLVDKHHRDRKSHEVAVSVRDDLQSIARQYNGNLKVVEVPPGPPVMSPLVAEIYGPDYSGQIGVAKELRKVFGSTPDIVDVDDSVEFPAKRYILHVDRQRAALLGISQSEVASAVNTAVAGEDVTFLHGDNVKYAVPIRLEFPQAEKGDIEAILSSEVRARSGDLVPLSEVVDIEEASNEHSIYHKDLLPVVYVVGDMVGELDSPLYGMFEISGELDDRKLEGAGVLDQYFIQQPENPYFYSMKWDGEWQVTYETFRDMGIAYAVGMILIYLLVVAQFKSYIAPLIIMAPIPLTVIGVMPGHALLGAKFTATSMIGMIALAGIIVRNSILLVDFINTEVKGGMPLSEAVIRSAAVRAKPIFLTGLAAMAGAFFILSDPIFSGLAVSLIFGLLVSTTMTLVVIPVVYYAYVYDKVEKVIFRKGLDG
ncbi:MAG: efflux RND transporter permease subunit [bacterium]